MVNKQNRVNDDSTLKFENFHTYQRFIRQKKLKWFKSWKTI